MLYLQRMFQPALWQATADGEWWIDEKNQYFSGSSQAIEEEEIPAGFLWASAIVGSNL